MDHFFFRAIIFYFSQIYEYQIYLNNFKFKKLKMNVEEREKKG